VMGTRHALQNVNPSFRMQCYKHVAALLDKQIRKTKDFAQKMNVLFMFHNIIKEAKKAHGPKNKLSKCSLAARLRNHAVHAPAPSHGPPTTPVHRVRQAAHLADATLAFLCRCQVWQCAAWCLWAVCCSIR
jgi:hypothetical protein